MNCQLCNQEFRLRELYTKVVPVKEDSKVLYFCYSCIGLIDEHKVGTYSDHVLFKLEQANEIIQAYFNETTLKDPQGNCTCCLAPLYHECTSDEWEKADFDIQNTCKTCVLKSRMTLD